MYSSAAKQWAQMEGQNCREMPGAAGLQRVLEEKSGDAGTSPGVCDASAACCRLRERGPVCFEPKRADEGLA